MAAAAVVVSGIGAAFATSAAEPSEESRYGDNDADTEVVTQTVISYTDSDDGVTYYSTDGGRTFAPEAEFTLENLAPEVEWWNYEDYGKWLENEKKELENMLGEKGYTGGRGEFIWTQEIIDETIAMYEQTLEDIKNGYMISKSVDGTDAVVLARYPDNQLSLSDTESPVEIPPTEEYEPFGITVNENALYYNGEKIYYFEDSAEIGDGGVASKCVYCCDNGTVSLRTVRKTVNNPDGSADPFGPIVRLEKLSAKEAEKKIEAYRSASCDAICEVSECSDGAGNAESNHEAIAYASGTEVNEGIPVSDMFDKYKIYGISYEETETKKGMERNLYLDGKPVNNFADINPDGGVFTFGSTRQSDDGIDAYAIYKNGKLTGVEQRQ